MLQNYRHLYRNRDKEGMPLKTGKQRCKIPPRKAPIWRGTGFGSEVFYFDQIEPQRTLGRDDKRRRRDLDRVFKPQL